MPLLFALAWLLMLCFGVMSTAADPVRQPERKQWLTALSVTCSGFLSGEYVGFYLGRTADWSPYHDPATGCLLLLATGVCGLLWAAAVARSKQRLRLARVCLEVAWVPILLAAGVSVLDWLF